MLWQIKSHVISKHYFCTDNKKKHGTNIMKIFIYKIEIWNLKKNMKISQVLVEFVKPLILKFYFLTQQRCKFCYKLLQQILLLLWR